MSQPAIAARPSLVLPVLFIGAFIMGCAEMLVVGMLDLIAVDLRVSVSDAGNLVAANAIGLAVGGPLLTFLTTRFDRRTLLIGSLVVFVALNLLPAFGADYVVFMVARVLIGAVQGLFIAAAMVTATSIVAPERAGRAMSLVISGFATASALGLPLGTLLGQAVGWRGSFVAVVGVGVLILLVAVALIPSVPTATDSHAAGQARHAFAPRVLVVLGVAVLIFAGMLSAITYLVPYLDEVAGVTGPTVSVFLLAYGASTAVGSFLGGRFADANAARSLIIGAIGVTLSLVAMLLLGSNPWLLAVTVVGIGLMGMGTGPSLQHRVVGLAGPGAPLASSLPASAVNAGIALGSFAGGVAIQSAGVSAAIVTALAISVLAIAAAAASSTLTPARATVSATAE